jgi:hypothetical protein
MTVGIDGGFVRAAHKEGWFEVIAGKSVVAFRREENDERPSAKCFGFVQTYDEKPRRRLWELLKSQGMQENQQVTFLSDGGDTVRQLQEYLHPCSEHLIDWFHITMRLTVLQQQAKGLQAERLQFGQEISRQIESVKHLLWHGNTEEALERIARLNIELDLLRAFSPSAEKLGKSLSEFETYIRNNIEFIPNFGERYRQGETISTAFVESWSMRREPKSAWSRPVNDGSWNFRYYGRPRSRQGAQTRGWYAWASSYETIIYRIERVRAKARI